MTKISSLTALTGAGVDTAADLIPVVDMSEAGAARNKKQTYAEFLLALKEGIQDIVSVMAVAGTNITLTYDDGAGTITIDATAPVSGDISDFNEAVDDRVAALITAGSGITKSYNDGAGTLTLTAAIPSGGLELKGSTDCSANPNYPAGEVGDVYYVSVAGKIGGASGKSVDVGDAYICKTDNAGGTEASVGTSWFVLEHNLSGVISGSLASTTEQLTGTDNAKLSTPDSVAALWEQGSDVASSGTVSLGEGGYFNITGTTTITDIDFATDKAGRKAWVKFAGVLTLTHNASTLILPTGASITTAAGDTACFISEGSDVVRCVAYQRASGQPLTGGGGGGSGTYRKVFKPTDNEPPASNYATLDTRNSRACLDFDGTTSESALFSDVLSSGYGGGGLTVKLIIRATSATSGDCKFEVSFERGNTDNDTDSFATAKSVTMTVNGTSGISTTGSISFSNSEIDGLLAGEEYYIKVTRLPADAADTVASDIELSKVEVAE